MDLSQLYVDRSIDVNIRVPIFLIKNLVDCLHSIININSIAGIERKKRTIYCTTKSALKVFSETLSLECDVHILDVYDSKLRKDRNDFCVDVEIASEQVLKAHLAHDRSLIIDERPRPE